MLKKLYHYFKFLFNKNSNTEIINISIFLRPNYEIDIELAYPDWSKLEDKNIPDIAEKYAELLIYINSNLFKNKIINTIENNSKNSQEIKQKLFFDNIISFYDIIKTNLINNTNNGPLISPSSVFNGKQL